MNRIIYELESNGLRLTGESWSMYGDCHGRRRGLREMSSDGLWQEMMEKLEERGEGVQTSVVQGTWDCHSSPADGNMEFSQGVVLDSYRKVDLLRYNSLPLLVAE